MRNVQQRVWEHRALLCVLLSVLVAFWSAAVHVVPAAPSLESIYIAPRGGDQMLDERPVCDAASDFRVGDQLSGLTKDNLVVPMIALCDDDLGEPRVEWYCTNNLAGPCGNGLGAAFTHSANTILRQRL